MTKKIEDYKVDRRALKLNMARGEITKKEYQDYLESLPDLSKQMEELPAYFEEEEEQPNSEEAGNLTFSVA